MAKKKKKELKSKPLTNIGLTTTKGKPELDAEDRMLMGLEKTAVVESSNYVRKPKILAMPVLQQKKEKLIQETPEIKELIASAALVSGQGTQVAVFDKINLIQHSQDPHKPTDKDRFESAGRLNHAVKGALGVRRHFIFSKGSELIFQLPDEEMQVLGPEKAMEKQKKLKENNQEILIELEKRDKRLKLIKKLKVLQMQRWIFGRGALIKLFDESGVIQKLQTINSKRLGDPIIDTDKFFDIAGVFIDGQPLSIKSMIYATYNEDELSPHTENYGYSEIEAVADEAETLDILLNEDIKEISRTNYMPSVILKISTASLDNATASAKVRKIVNAVAKAGKVIGINEEVDAVTVEMEPDFQGLTIIIEKLETIVYKTLQVPQFMVQSESAANRATAVQSATQFLNGPVADDQEDISDVIQDQWYDRFLISNIDKIKDENGKEIKIEEGSDLPFHIRRVFNQAKASEFVDMAQAVATLKRENIWDVKKCNEVLGSEEVTPRIEAALKEFEKKMEKEKTDEDKNDEDEDDDDAESPATTTDGDTSQD